MARLCSRASKGRRQERTSGQRGGEARLSSELVGSTNDVEHSGSGRLRPVGDPPPQRAGHRFGQASQCGLPHASRKAT